MNSYCQYGCGLSNPPEFINFDSSPTLRIQKVPLLGKIFKLGMKTKFPDNVIYGDIIKGLPVKKNSMKGVYCSHVLEHLSLMDLRVSPRNSYEVLEKGGIFRCVLPDLEWSCKEYLKLKDLGVETAANVFVDEFTMFGLNNRPIKLIDKVKSLYGNSKHLWMWDFESLKKELQEVGFKEIRRSSFNDSEDSYFNYVEDEGRFINCLAIECKK
jgi:hypothetical protein